MIDIDPPSASHCTRLGHFVFDLFLFCYTRWQQVRRFLLFTFNKWQLLTWFNLNVFTFQDYATIREHSLVLLREKVLIEAPKRRKGK